jgi:hypothetical protein
MVGFVLSDEIFSSENENWKIEKLKIFFLYMIFNKLMKLKLLFSKKKTSGEQLPSAQAVEKQKVCT